MEETPDSLADLSDDATELQNTADQEMHRETKPQAELKYLQSVTNERKINNWLEMKVANFRQTPATETELEKMRQDMELAMLKYQYEEKQKQRQHKEKMELMRLQASGPAAEGLQDLLRPQDQLSLFLYCFIFIHVIYAVRELLFFFVKKHHLFVIAVTLLYLIKKLWNYLWAICSSSSYTSGNLLLVSILFGYEGNSELSFCGMRWYEGLHKGGRLVTSWGFLIKFVS
ncbi:PREDICTED: transmembrane protein 247 [Crocodylus porosus]|nr:PREDICTED: transmembrane protein 247 [Crocodylus porosus]